MRNIEKNVCRAWKDNDMHDMQKKMFAEKSDELLKNISSKTEIKTKSNKIVLQILSTQDLQNEQAQKCIQLDISKWLFYNIKTNNKLVNS